MDSNSAKSGNYPLISILLVNWKGWKDTIECLESLLFVAYSSFNVIIVDNNSEDSSIEEIRKYCKEKQNEYSENPKDPFPFSEYSNIEADQSTTFESISFTEREIILIKNDKNDGFAGGNNIAATFALRAFDPDYILLLNNDTVVDQNFLGELIRLAESDASVGLVQPKLVYYFNNAKKITGMKLDVWGGTEGRRESENDEDQEINDDLTEKDFFYASGACCLIRKDLILKLGGIIFDPRLFLHFEDVDLSWRARIFGFKIKFCPKSIVYHKEGQSTGIHSPNTMFWGFRNRIRVMIKNYSKKNLIWTLPVTLILELSLSLINTLHQKNINFMWSFFRSIGWNLLNIRNTLYLRSLVQSERQMSDQYIMYYMKWRSIEIHKLIRSLNGD